jgi:hypothetical protein
LICGTKNNAASSRLIDGLAVLPSAQSVGMAGSLCEEVPEAKALFDKASTILGYDLLDKV